MRVQRGNTRKDCSLGTYGVGFVDEVAKDDHDEQCGSDSWSFTLLAKNKVRLVNLR